MAKNDSRGKRSSSKARLRREEQLDLFPHDLKLAPAPGSLGGVRRTAPRNQTSRQRATGGAPLPVLL
jgi:hypothetical protein